MAWNLHASGLANFPAATSFLWAAVLLCPFLFVAVVAWRSRAGAFPGILAVLAAFLLAAAPLACISDRFSEGCKQALGSKQALEQALGSGLSFMHFAPLLHIQNSPIGSTKHP